MVLDNSNSSGNRALFELPKTAFLASKKIPPEQVLRCYDWAVKVRDESTPIMSGFHSPLEKDVLGFLLKGRAPLIVVLARSLYHNMPLAWQNALAANRLLIISAVESRRASANTTRLRNRFIIAHATQIVVGSLTVGGDLEHYNVNSL